MMIDRVVVVSQSSLVRKEEQESPSPDKSLMEEKETFMGKQSSVLSQEQRQTLEQFVKTGTAPARALLHAQGLLKADASSQGPRWSERQIEAAFAVP